MINMSLLVPVFLENYVLQLRACIPNVGIPLKQIAVRVSLESVRCKLILNQMLAHGVKCHV